MKKNIITIGGLLGSGKSSTAKAVASALGFRHFSSGDLFRQIAAERGESIEAMNISAEAQRDIDIKVDKLLQEMYRNEERSEEHTSELQSHLNLVCRLLLEKKKHNLTTDVVLLHQIHEPPLTCLT